VNYLQKPINIIINILVSAKNAYIRSKDISETIKELNKLSDADLKDIGISRGEIYSVAHRLQEQESVQTNPNLKGWV